MATSPHNVSVNFKKKLKHFQAIKVFYSSLLCLLMGSYLICYEFQAMNKEGIIIYLSFLLLITGKIASFTVKWSFSHLHTCGMPRVGMSKDVAWAHNTESGCNNQLGTQGPSLMWPVYNNTPVPRQNTKEWLAQTHATCIKHKTGDVFAPQKGHWWAGQEYGKKISQLHTLSIYKRYC